MRYAKYKPTGIAWLPEVPEEWECAALKYFVLKIGSGKTPTGGAEVYREDGVMFLRSQNVYDEGLYLEDVSHISEEIDSCMTSTRVQKGDVLLNITGGSIGRCCVYDKDERANVNQHVCIIRCDPVVDNYYVKYYWNSVGKSYVNVSQQTGNRESLNFQQIGNAHLPLAPLPTQRAIVTFLNEKCGKVDRLVAAKEKEVALLKELKQSMIAEAVTRGVPTALTQRTQSSQRDAEGFDRINRIHRIDGEAPQTSLRSSANSAFFASAPAGNPSRRLVPSGIPWLPEVPEGWASGKVRQYFKLRATKVSEKDYPPLSVAKIGVVPQLSDVALSMAEGDTRKLVKEGDYVVNSRSDRKGSCGIAPRDGSVTTISIVLEPHDIDRKYVHYLFRSTPWVEEFYRNGRGIVADLWTTNYNQMRNMMLPVPPLAEQREIVAHIEAKAAKIDAAVSGLEKEIAALKEYKQRLIADVVTGQRKVA